MRRFHELFRQTTQGRHSSRTAGEHGTSRAAWTVDPWGQGILSVEIRDAIQRGESRLRFLPDLIAARNGELITIDCKDRMRSTDSGRYAVTRQRVNFGLHIARLASPVLRLRQPRRAPSHGGPGIRLEWAASRRQWSLLPGA
jgi:hypothetical protein